MKNPIKMDDLEVPMDGKMDDLEVPMDGKMDDLEVPMDGKMDDLEVPLFLETPTRHMEVVIAHLLLPSCYSLTGSCPIPSCW